MKRLFIATALSLLAVFSFTTLVSAADEKDHRVVIHVDENDKALMNLALNNITNINKYYESVGETVEIELVAYGPGLHMFRADTSPVVDRVTNMSLLHENLTFSACANTHAVMSKKADKEIELLEEAAMVPSGVVQLIALQEEGYAYIRP